jgi:predicted transcriptional regulator
LLPIGGVARLQRIPENPMQELIVAAAGPAVNVLIALILYLVLMLGNNLPQAGSLQEFMGQGILPDLLLVNISLVVFNLIPAFPMDGGRMLRAFLAFRLDREKATRYAAGIGQIFAVGFVLLGFFNNPVLMLIGVFIFLGARSEAAHVTRTAMLKEVKVAEVVVTNYVLLQEDMNLQSAANELLSVEQQDFLVADSAGNIAGVLTRDALLKGIAMHGLEIPVKNVMGKSIQGIQLNDKVSEIYQRMAEEEVAAVPVYQDQVLKGMLTLTNIREYFLVKHAVQMFRK